MRPSLARRIRRQTLRAQRALVADNFETQRRYYKRLRETPPEELTPFERMAARMVRLTEPLNHEDYLT